MFVRLPGGLGLIYMFPFCSSGAPLTACVALPSAITDSSFARYGTDFVNVPRSFGLYSARFDLRFHLDRSA